MAESNSSTQLAGHAAQSPEPRSLSQIRFCDPHDMSDQLCTNCARLKFDVLDEHGYIYNGLQELGTWETLTASACPLCRLFAVSGPSPTAMSQYPKQCPVYLLASHLYEAFGGDLDPTDDKRKAWPPGIVFRVACVPTSDMMKRKNVSTTASDFSPREYGYVGLMDARRMSHYSRDLGACLIQPDAFDFDIARQWWQYCREHHGKDCGQPRSSRPHSLKVMDCISQMVVDAPPDCRYAALSYVWGTAPQKGDAQKAETPGTFNGLHNLPKTIRDSMQVALRMDLRYLWVDRYCIDQTDHGDKHRQIQQMDLIYSSADLTIVAAAGSRKRRTPWLTWCQWNLSRAATVSSGREAYTMPDLPKC